MHQHTREAPAYEKRRAHAFLVPLMHISRYSVEESFGALLAQNGMLAAALEIHLRHENWPLVINCYRLLELPQKVSHSESSFYYIINEYS